MSLYLDDPDGHKVEISYDSAEAIDNLRSTANE